jgi:hypothetical protein
MINVLKQTCKQIGRLLLWKCASQLKLHSKMGIEGENTRLYAQKMETIYLHTKLSKLTTHPMGVLYTQPFVLSFEVY